jgi:hypothetical protein
VVERRRLDEETGLWGGRFVGTMVGAMARARRHTDQVRPQCIEVDAFATGRVDDDEVALRQGVTGRDSQIGRLDNTTIVGGAGTPPMAL